MCKMVIVSGLEMQWLGFKPNLLGLIDQILGDLRPVLDLGFRFYFFSLKWEERPAAGHRR